MAKFVRGTTKQKGCYVCGRGLFKFGGGDQALVLEDSKGRIAVCSPACGNKYDPEVDLDEQRDEPNEQDADDG